MSCLAIKGHVTRGKEVIEILEMLGGKTHTTLWGNLTFRYYYIKSDGFIDYKCHSTSDDIILYSLEEFLERFPYKIGDKVQHKGATSCGSVFEIEKIQWVDNDVKYTVKCLWNNNGHTTFTAKGLQPYKEETIEETIIDTIKESADRYRIKVNYQFDIEVDEGEYYAVRRKPQYPKTYEECCKVLNIPSNGNIAYVGDWVYGGEYLEKHLDRLRKFQQLLICRDAYWKMAGDQMGLGKPWEPRCDDGYQRKWIIFCQNGINFTNCFKGHFVLAFPTAEIRDTFYENFKELIELCKELL